MMKRLFILFALALISGAGAFAQTNVGAIENILTRHSVRKFDTQRPVEQGKIDTLLRAGLAAPSSRDMRPWHLVVINGAEAIGKYAANNARATEQIKGTPLIILVCGDRNDFQQGEAELYWALDCSTVAQNILLAAHAQGLGAVWGSVFPGERKMNGIKRALNLPDNLVPFAQIRIGYSADDEAEIKDKWDEKKITIWQ